MERITYEIEWNIERFHWWFAGRRELLRFLLSSLEPPEGSSMMDAGCGVGSNLNLLSSMGFRVFGVDAEIYSLSFAKTISDTPLINGDLLTLPVKTGSIDLVIATDILEHLLDDTRGIQEIYRTLKQNGKVIFTVPAFAFLWGTQDIVGMHRRRYSRKDFLNKIEDQGFRILRTSYFNFLLFFPVLFGRLMIRSFGLKIKSENRINSGWINVLFRSIFSLEARLLKHISFPFGVSIFCVAQK